MASVYGSKIKEPTVTRRNVLPVDERANYAADLAKAWSSFGEAKSVLDKLESKPEPLPSATHSNAVHNSKSSAVRFKRSPNSAPVKLQTRLNSDDKDTVALPHVTGILKGSKHAKESMYVIDPLVLNEEGSDKVHPYKIADSCVTDKPPVALQTFSNTALKNSGVRTVSSAPLHSNPTAVFGPPVSFGGNQQSSTSKTSQPFTPERQLHNHSTLLPTQANPLNHPGLISEDKTGLVSGPIPSIQTIRVLPHSPQTVIKPNIANGRRIVHIRKFELPPGVVGTLSTKVELQKQALRDKNGSDRHEHAKSHPCTGNSLAQAGVTKKRKVASVPPPPTYSGFSTMHSTVSDIKAPPLTGLRTTNTPLQWKTNVENIEMATHTTTLASKEGYKPPTGRHTQVSSVGRDAQDRVRKIHRMRSLDVNAGHQQVGSVQQPSGIITTSSWRTGKELADKILRQSRSKKQEHPQSTLSSPPSSLQLSSESSHDLTHPHGTQANDTQVHSSKATRDIGPTSKDVSRREFNDILVDLDLSSNDGDQEEDDRPKGIALKRSLTKVLSAGNEPECPTKRANHYEQANVKAYMQHQKEERRQKAQEERQMLSNASSERQKKLRELYETQRKRVEANLRVKQKKREAYAKSLSAGIHIHLYDTGDHINGSETSENQLPSVTIHPAPLTKHPYSSSTRKPLSKCTTLSQTSVPSRAPPLSSSPLHLHSSPSPYPHTSPSQFNTNKPTQKPRSPVASNSHLTHALHSSPTSPALRVANSTAHAQFNPGTYHTVHTSPPIGKLTALLRRSSQGAEVLTPSPPRSSITHEERLQTIKNSALKLKERIANESKKLYEDSFIELSPQQYRTHFPSSSHISEPTRYHHQASKQEPTPAVELPGIGSIYDHALQAERQRRQSEAAIIIQAAYRGHTVRKSLKWMLPSGHTLNSMIKGTRHLEKHTPTYQTEPLTSVTYSTPAQLSPASSMPVSRSGVAGDPNPNDVPSLVDPWKQEGGDRHSVINVFTRQQEKLRETLSELSSQKREVIRGIPIGKSTEECPPVHVSVNVSASLSPLEGMGEEETSDQAQLSYSQTFEPTSSIQNGEALHNVSLSSASFSHDSLLSQPSAQSSLQSTQQTISEKLLSSPIQTEHISSADKLSDVSLSSHKDRISAITPPGSQSFVESFTSDLPSLTEPVPSSVEYSPPYPPVTSGRLSPRSLELKHNAHLNLYETLEEHLRHVAQVERATVLSRAQQETVALAQQFKAHDEVYKENMDTIACKARKDVEVVQSQLKDETKHTSERMKHLQEQVDVQMKEHSRRLAEMQKESAHAAREATLRLNEARSAATSAVIDAAQQQIQAAHTMAISVATAATKEAVREAMKQDFITEPKVDQEEGLGEHQMVDQEKGLGEHQMEEPHYDSDFDPSTMQPDSLIDLEQASEQNMADQTPSTETVSMDVEESSATLTPSTVGNGIRDSTLVEKEKGESSQCSSPQVVEEEVGSEDSLNEVPLSRNRHSKGFHRNEHNSSSDSEEIGVTSSSLHTRILSQDDHQSPFSPAGNDSFFMFTSRMVAEYVKQEELRASHQAALLHLREAALKDKTQTQLKWLQLKKRDLRSKGADDLMPPLKKKEKGLLREFKQEQAEIHRLKEAQKAARHERKLMLLDQKEISQIRKSTQYYREKIRSYRSRSQKSPSPAFPIDESNLRDYSRSITPDYSIFSEISEVEEGHETSSTPSEHLEVSSIHQGTSPTATFPTYSYSEVQDNYRNISVKSNPAITVPEHLEGASSSHRTVSKSGSSLTSKPREKSVTPKSSSSDSVVVKNLHKMTPSEAEKYLARRKQSLLKQRKAAERVLQQHRDLLRKHQELDKEENSVNRLVEEAMEMLTKTGSASPHVNYLSGKVDPQVSVQKSPLSHHSQDLSEQLCHSRSSETATEDVMVSSSIQEEISVQDGAISSQNKSETVATDIPSVYAADTFESLDSSLSHDKHTPITTSTPELRSQEHIEFGDLSLTDSVHVLGSVSESVMTTTSSGSVLEERIHELKKQLRQRKEEVKRIQNDQKRKKKAILKQQEETLKRKLEAVDQKVKRVIASPLSLCSPLVDSRTPPTQNVLNKDEHHSTTPFKEGFANDNDSLFPDHPLNSQLLGEVISPHKDVSILSGQENVSYTPFTSIGSVTEDTVLNSSEGIPEKERNETCMPTQPVPVEQPPTEGGNEDKSISEDLTMTEDIELHTESIEPLVPPPGFEGQSDDLATNSYETATDNNLHEGNSPLGDEEQMESEYSEDFEPGEQKEEHSPQSEYSDMEAMSDSSLISDSKGGDSGEEANYYSGQKVLVGGVMEGIVRFVGHTHFSSGIWIGIEIGEPRGKNDGSVDGKKYFNCPPKRGLFAPPGKVSIIDDILDEHKTYEDSLQGSSIDEELESVSTENDMEELEAEEENNEIIIQPQENSNKQVHPFDVGHWDEHIECFEPSKDENDNQSTDANFQYESYTQSPQVDTLVKTCTEDPQVGTLLKTCTEDQTTEGTSVAEQQAPAAVESVGQQPDNLPKAPEVTLQRLQSANPTPAPPPEFAAGASRVASTELTPSTTDPLADCKSEKICDEIAQELMNEAYQAMYQIWKTKHDKECVPPEVIQSVELVRIPMDKYIPLGVNEKADQITDQLMSLLLLSETRLMSNIHTSKRETEQCSNKKHLVIEPPKSPPKPRPSLQISLTGGVLIKDSSPPPISPPSPYRNAMGFSIVDHSPPGSPPYHFQSTIARVTAGDKSLSIKPEPPPSKLERTTSMESVVNLLDSIKVTTAHCMVPSERPHIDMVVENAWRLTQDIGFSSLHTMEVSCPCHVIDLFKNVRILSPEEEHCHQAYIKLVFGLTLEVIRFYYPPQEKGVVFLHGSAVKAPLVYRNEQEPTLETIQKQVYAALIRGQLPAQLPAVKFLHRMKRPGGKEVDFVDSILIKELRREEPGWIDFHKDETTVKIKTSDNILDSLISEAVQIMCDIENKRKQKR